MIERYQTKDMSRIWSEQNKYYTWYKVEVAVVKVLSDIGLVPKESLQNIEEKASYTIDRILEIEKTTNHDVIAFLTNLSESIGPDSRFIHMGMTSSDLLDTSLAIQCKDAGEIILEKLNDFHKVLCVNAKKYKYTIYCWNNNIQPYNHGNTILLSNS